MMPSNPLEEFWGSQKTRMGQAFPGKRAVFRGHDLHHDLHDMSWFELNLFGISGKRFDKHQLRLLDMVCKVTSYPDLRLWNNRVAALAGSARSTSTLGLAGAVAITEAQLFGIRAAQMCGDFLVRAQQRLDQGEVLADIIKHEIAMHKYIKGFGRPMAVTEQDERFPAIFRVLEEENLQPGKYMQLVFQIEQSMMEMGLSLRANYAAFGAAVPLDMGLSLPQVVVYLFLYMLAGMGPCYLEALERPEGATLPIKCTQINYTGPSLRKWDDLA